MEQGLIWITLLLLVVFFITAFLLAHLLLFKDGDERYRIIKEKTSTTTLIFSMGLLFYQAGKQVFSIWNGSIHTGQSLGPILTLCIISIFFCGSFLFYRKRYS